MKLNTLSAFIAFCASALWACMGQNVTAVIWLAASIVWLTLALIPRRRAGMELNSGHRLFRRLSRLLLFS